MLDQVSVSESEDAQRRQEFPAGAAVTLEDLEQAGREHVLDELREALHAEDLGAYRRQERVAVRVDDVVQRCRCTGDQSQQFRSVHAALGGVQ